MKCWIGEELEGSDKGILTLFVSGITVQSSIILRVIKDTECKRIYLGAGRLDFCEVLNSKLLIDYCRNNDTQLIVETSLSALKYSFQNTKLFEDATQIIVRFDEDIINKIGEDDIIKIDTKTDVFLISKKNMINTDLQDLKCDMFITDKLVYDDKEGGFIS